MIYNIVSKIAVNLLPKLIEEAYTHIVDNIDDARDYIADTIKTDRPEKPIRRVFRFSKAQIRWIESNYNYFKHHKKLTNGTSIESDDEFAKYSNKLFNATKSACVYREIARLGYKYYTYPDRLEEGEELPDTYISKSTRNTE